MADNPPSKPKQWIFNAFTMNTPGHLAAGRVPDRACQENTAINSIRLVEASEE